MPLACVEVRGKLCSCSLLQPCVNSGVGLMSVFFFLTSLLLLSRKCGRYFFMYLLGLSSITPYFDGLWCPVIVFHLLQGDISLIKHEDYTIYGYKDKYLPFS